jgi:hypothetical protein
MQQSAADPLTPYVNLLLPRRHAPKHQVTAEELSLLIGKFNVQMAPYGVFGEAIADDLLPFQQQPVPGSV